MKIEEIGHLVKTALIDFGRDKVRTGLTSLGIMIGVLSVVLLIALGVGLKNYIQEQFQNLGASLIMVLPGSGFSEGFGAGMMGGIEFDEKDLRSLERLPNLKYVVPLTFKSVKASVSDTEKVIYLMGVNEDYFPLINTKISHGRVWTRSDVSKKSKVAVLGNTTAKEMFGDEASALNKSIRISGSRFVILGVAEKTGDPERDTSATVPYTSISGSINPDKKFWSIYIGVESENQVESAKESVIEILSKRYDDDQFSVTEQSEILGTINQIFGMINMVLLAIGSISLLVGGIGIMNIMYATVMERTKEVGIRRAVGATRRDVLLQFLTESTLLSLLGGITGLVLAIIIVLIVRIWFPVAINVWAVVTALGVSCGIGVFFGVFPAKKAADMSPIDAIRYE
jgi:putative ABC transport system permease protein